MNLHVSFLGLILLVHVTLVTYTVASSQICYEAKTCIHNAKEKCGIDSKGIYRRFFDTCDILEYNCLYNTDFDTTDTEKCKNLPPIPDDQKSDQRKHLSKHHIEFSASAHSEFQKELKRSKREIEDGVLSVANQWWCWEGSRCSLRPDRSLKPVCGWENQSQRRFKFPSVCVMAKENCSKRRDFHVIKVKKCKETITRRKLPTNFDADADLLE